MKARIYKSRTLGWWIIKWPDGMCFVSTHEKAIKRIDRLADAGLFHAQKGRHDRADDTA